MFDFCGVFKDQIAMSEDMFVEKIETVDFETLHGIYRDGGNHPFLKGE